MKYASEVNSMGFHPLW